MTQLNDGFEIKTKMKVNTCYSCKKNKFRDAFNYWMWI